MTGETPSINSAEFFGLEPGTPEHDDFEALPEVIKTEINADPDSFIPGTGDIDLSQFPEADRELIKHLVRDRGHRIEDLIEVYRYDRLI